MVLPRFQGLRVAPVSGLSLDALQPNSVVVVLPTMAAPCAFTRSDTGESCGEMKSASVREPEVKRTPLTAVRSLIDSGSPASRPPSCPDITAASAARAASARSAVTRHEGIERRLQRLETPQRALDNFNRRGLLGSDQATQIERGQVGELLRPRYSSWPDPMLAAATFHDAKPAPTSVSGLGK